MARTIEISDETFEKLKTQLGEDCYREIVDLKDMIGEKFFFRTVTYHMTGRVKRIIIPTMGKSTAISFFWELFIDTFMVAPSGT